MGEHSIRSYRDLLVWQRGMDLTEGCYSLVSAFPDSERFGLVSQIRRAAVSIPANIAEGHGRELPGSFVQHLRIAQGSLKELETLLLISQRTKRCEPEQSDALLKNADELGRMIRALIRTLQEKL